MNIHWIDTTLRDGEQMPGFAFLTSERIQLINLLKQTDIAGIEVFGPVSWCSEDSVIQSLITIKGPPLIAWNRAVAADIRKSINAGFKHIHISLPISQIHIKHKLNRDFSWVLRQISYCVGLAKSYGCQVYVGAEDASRATDEAIVQYAITASDAGADRIRFADTVGRMTPFEVYERMKRLSDYCSLQIEFHAHNDFGLALANAMAAHRANISYLSGTIFGIGERAGNLNMSKALLQCEQSNTKENLLRVKDANNIVQKAFKRCNSVIDELSFV